MSILILDDDDFINIWKEINNLQLVFHPRISPEGVINYKQFLDLKRQKKVFVIWDRNLVSSLLDLTRKGSLTNTCEMRTVALLMVWTIMNGLHASPGLALMENATRNNDCIKPKLELQEFVNAFSYYPSMTWLHLLNGTIDKIPIYAYPIKPHPTSNDYDYEDDHLLMHMATMINIVCTHRDKTLSPIDKMLKFLEWFFDNLLICETTIAYAAMLFTNQSNIRAPKFSNSSDKVKILLGCRNQAWDINYLSNWSCYHYDEQNMDEVFLFASNDNQIKRILLNTFTSGGLNSLISTIFSKSDSVQLFSLFNSKLGGKRIKPDFGNDPRVYFKQLIAKETERLEHIIAET